MIRGWKRALVVAAFGLPPVWAATSGAAQTRPDLMPLGAESAPPAGFIELCERAPVECATTDRPSAAALADIRVWAGRARWAGVFQAAGLAQPAATEPSPPQVAVKATKTSRQTRSQKDTARKRMTGPARKTGPQRPAQQITPPVAPPVAPPVVTPVATVSVQDLERVNRRVNRAVRSLTDADAFGREDVWHRPEGSRPAGDCEDYVLAKRHALIEMGVDPATLSVAIVRTTRGEVHAVLLVATAGGERVMDNLSPWVVHWREVRYEWLERQAPGRPLTWVRAAARAA